MIYLIEQLILAPMENQFYAAAYYEPIGYTTDIEEARKIVIDGGAYEKSDCWALKYMDNHNKYRFQIIEKAQPAVPVKQKEPLCTACGRPHCTIHAQNIPIERCERGCGRPADGFHPCPYSQDIDGNDDDICNCCVQCQNICVDDV